MSEKLHVVRDKGDPPCRGVWEDDGPLRGVFVGPHAEHDAHIFAGAERLKEAADKLIPTLRRRNGWLTELPDKFLDADEELEAAAKSCEPPEATDVDT